MGLPRLAVRRPVTTVMALGIAVLTGLIALAGIPVDLLPDLSFPVIAVITRYPGAGPREVESLVTRPLEEAIGAANNLRIISSDSMEGVSVIIAQFEWGTNMDVAALDVREKIDLVRRLLPGEATAPMVVKADPSLMPMMQIALSGPGDLAGLTLLAEAVMKDRLERVDGVASVTVVGGARREIAVQADPARLDGYGLSLAQLAQALRLENLSLPGGEVEEAGRRLVIRTVGEFQTVDEIADVVFRTPMGGLVRLRDVAVVEDTFAEPRSYARLNGRPSVSLSLQKQSGANTVQVARQVHAALDLLRAELPPGVEVAVAMDQSHFINRSVRAVGRNAATGALLAVLVLLAFLQDFRSTLVIAAAIPVSVVATFALMYFAGLSLNLMSLGGLALGVGMLVDNAIVVLENIHRHYGQGKDPVAGAVAGAGEVGTAVTASTLTTVAVFLPILFIQGLASILFRQIAITVSFALLASLAVALTFIPMASAQLARRARLPESAGPAGRGRLDRLQDVYRRVLVWALEHRREVLIAAAAIALAGLLAYRLLGTEFLPAVDQREITVAITVPRGSTLEETDRAVRRVEDVAARIPELETMFATAGGGGGVMGGLGGGGSRDRGRVDLRLTPAGRPTDRVAEDLRREVAAIPGARIEVDLVSNVAGEGYLFGTPIAVRVLGSDLDTLGALAGEVAGRVAAVRGVTNVNTSVGEGVPELRVVVDRARASFYGLTVAVIATTVRTAIEGEVATRYRVSGSEVDIRVRLDESSRSTPADLRRLTLLAPLGVPVRLDEVAHIVEVPGPPVIQRENQSRLVTVTAAVSGRDVGRTTEDVRRSLAGLRLPAGYSLEFGGQSREMTDAFATLRWALALAVILVYMVLASQFESLVQPLLIMVAVPLAFVGALLALALAGHTLNVPALIGIIALAGIVVNNAIVFIDYLNRLRAAGIERTEAIVQAGQTRLRPILMTTTTTVLGLAPLAVGWGAGVEIQAPLATAIIGGLILSTLLTLVLVPVLYAGLEDLAGLARRRYVTRR